MAGRRCRFCGAKINHIGFLSELSKKIKNEHGVYVGIHVTITDFNRKECCNTFKNPVTMHSKSRMEEKRTTVSLPLCEMYESMKNVSLNTVNILKTTFPSMNCSETGNQIQNNQEKYWHTKSNKS